MASSKVLLLLVWTRTILGKARLELPVELRAGSHC